MALTPKPVSKTKPNPTPDQVINYLLSGGTADKVLAQTGWSRNKLVLSLMSSPSGLKKLNDKVLSTAGMYDKYDPNKMYDTTAKNEVRDQFSAYGENYRPLIDQFFNEVKRTGNSPKVVSNITNSWKDKKDFAKMFPNISTDEVAILTKELTAAAPKYMEQELKNKNKNFEFFNAKQKEFGVTGSGQTASGALWNSLTGAPSLRGFLDVVPNETTKAANTRKKKILLGILGEGNLSK